VANNAIERSTNYEDLGKALSRLGGTCTLFLFLFWNPLVLRPRVWSLSAIAFLVTMDATLLAAGMGLILLRKWGALLVSASTLFLLVRTGQSEGIAWVLILLVPLPFTIVFWRILIWGNKRFDPLLALGSVTASGVINYIAYAMNVRR
jgi:hypothetical protein